MATSNFEQIKRLIEDLKVNDMEEEELYKREEPEEPREAMEALIKIGEPAVEPLIELLKNPKRLSCAYAKDSRRDKR